MHDMETTMKNTDIFINSAHCQITEVLQVTTHLLQQAFSKVGESVGRVA